MILKVLIICVNLCETISKNFQIKKWTQFNDRNHFTRFKGGVGVILKGGKQELWFSVLCVFQWCFVFV